MRILRKLTGFQTYDRPVFSVDREIVDNLRRLQSLGLFVTHAVDVGAHRGTWTRNLLSLFPDSKVILIEPQAELLVQSVLEVDNSNLVWKTCGAGPQEEYKSFKKHKRSDSSSFVLDQTLEFESEELTQVRRIDNLVSETWGANIAPQIIKLDCEGWDLEVLKGLGDLITRVEVVFIEAGLTNRLFDNSAAKVIAIMESHGFHPIDIAPAAINESTGLAWNLEITFINSRLPKYNSAFIWN